MRKALQAAGHDVFTPTLTGVGERSHLNSQGVNLSTHIADVVNLIMWEELSDGILCGHSYGGCVISGAADRVPERIRALVYLDAFVLEDGEALIDLLPPAQADGNASTDANADGDGWRVAPIPAEVFKVNAQDAAWVNRQCAPQSIATFEEPIKFSGGIDRITGCHPYSGYGLSTRVLRFPACHERAKKKGWKTRTMTCGHGRLS